MRIFLINTGNDAGVGGNANAQAWPPLGIISLASSLMEAFKDRLDLRLLDGQMESIDEIVAALERERPELVGISMYSTSIRNTVRIVQEAKEFGALTLLGNDHAAMHYETLLTYIPELDFVCTGDVGEETIVALVDALLHRRGLEDVPSLAFRSADQILTTSPRIDRRGYSSLDDLPIPQRNLLDRKYWQYYTDQFKRQKHRTFDPGTVQGVATINRARGCARSGRRCRYCGIANLVPRGSSGDLFWRDVAAAREQVGATFLYEAFDSATSWPALLEQWVEARPDELAGTRFFMYAQAAETTPRVTELFRRLGVFCINTGFDSGDTETLRLLKGRHDSLETNMRAATLWSEAGVEIYTSFVLVGRGTDQKTRDSLDRTLEFAEWLADSTLTVSLDSALLYPDKNAPLGRLIWFPELAKKESDALGWAEVIDFDVLQSVSNRWRNEVFLDSIELTADFARICRVDPQLLFDYSAEVARISDRYGLNFGQSQGGPAHAVQSESGAGVNSS